MARIWINIPTHSEGKYLVVRRDGTIPAWPHFVVGGDDPNGPAALRAYADAAEKNGCDQAFVADVRALADAFQARVDAKTGKPDPDAPPHRKDNQAIVDLMRGHGDLTRLK